VDRTVSVGNYFTAPPKEQVAIKRDGAIIRIQASASSNKTSSKNKNVRSTKLNIKPSTANGKFSFFDVLKEIKASNQSSHSASINNATMPNALFNVHQLRSTDNSSNFIPEIIADGVSLTSQIKTDLSNFISGLTSWGSKQKKLKSTIDKAALKADLSKKPEHDDSYRITIFEEAPPVEDEIAKIYPVFEKSQLATREIFEALAQDQEIDLSNVNESLDSMVESIERNPDALIWLAKLKQTDDYAYNHALNVSIMLMALASFMALPKKQVKDLGLAGLLQDIGKAKIPQEILNKAEAITQEEFELLKKHVDHALELLEVTDKSSGSISGTVILTISQHHERIDGTGYPYQLSEKQISLTGQMAGLIDTYCALTTNKVYAKGVYNQLALETIHSLRDTKFKGVLIDQLVQFLGIYPVSTLVELNTGEVAVVIQQNSVRRMLPRVMILLNPDKSKNEYPATINLINSPPTPTGEPYQIVRGLAPDSYGLSASNYYG
ncbi:MAG: HD-GYP domain-containing protein, partial [Bacteroidia bacterium]|nr:HD-GYP domain-containing protein [Methylotenera sp.]